MNTKLIQKNCEFIHGSENRISGFSFIRKFKRKFNKIYIITKKSSLKHMKINKEFDFNFITPFNYKRSILFTNQPRPPGKQEQQYLSIFCPVFDKEIQLSFKNKYEQTTIVKYGLDYVLYLFRWLSGFVPMVNMPNPETK